MISYTYEVPRRRALSFLPPTRARRVSSPPRIPFDLRAKETGRTSICRWIKLRKYCRNCSARRRLQEFPGKIIFVWMLGGIDPWRSGRVWGAPRRSFEVLEGAPRFGNGWKLEEYCSVRRKKFMAVRWDFMRSVPRNCFMRAPPPWYRRLLPAGRCTCVHLFHHRLRPVSNRQNHAYVSLFQLKSNEKTVDNCDLTSFVEFILRDSW